MLVDLLSPANASPMALIQLLYPTSLQLRLMAGLGQYQPQGHTNHADLPERILWYPVVH